MQIHAKTQNKDIIDTLFKLGLSVSYDRILAISTNLANAVIRQFEMDRLVCPVSLKRGLLTKGMVDNIDHNPGSTTATGSLHGTSVSLSQDLFPGQLGIERPIPLLTEDIKNETQISPIPESYSVMPPAALTNKDPPVPAVDGPVKGTLQPMEEAVITENR